MRGLIHEPCIDLEAEGLDNKYSEGTALIMAVRAKRPDLVKLLIDAGANLEAKTWTGTTALQAAAVNNDAESIALLMQAGAKDVGKALHRAAERKSLAAVKALLATGADANTVSYNKRTPLFAAVGNGHERATGNVIRSLIAAGANVNVADDEGRTPLIDAVSTDDAELVKLLVEAGANVQARDARQRSPLSETRSNAVAALLVSHLGDSVDGQIAKPLLKHAVDEGWTDIVDGLMQHGLNPNVTTALELAVHKQRRAIVQILLEHHADPNAADEANGSPPLETALMEQKDFAVAQMLVKHGADLNVNVRGMTILDRAKNDGATAAVEFLLKAGAKRDCHVKVVKHPVDPKTGLDWHYEGC